MKIIITLLISCISLTVFSQTDSVRLKLNPNKPVTLAEASCGQCKFGLKAKGCDLAVRIDGKAYFVDGTKIDEHGDAHASDGFCEAIRKAEIQGEVVNNRYKVTYFKLLPEPPKQ